MEVLAQQIQFGRPSTSFSDCSDRTKWRKIKKLRSEYTTEELAYATQMCLRASGKAEASYVMTAVTMASSFKASSYRSFTDQVRDRATTPEEALSVFVEGRFSKTQYLVVRSSYKVVKLSRLSSL